MKLFKLSKLTEEQQFRMLITVLYVPVLISFMYVSYVYEFQFHTLIIRDLAIAEGYVSIMFTLLWCISLL